MKTNDFFEKFIEEDEKEEMEELREEIREQVKIMIITMEVFWEELQKSSLPEEVKLAMLTAYGKKEK